MRAACRCKAARALLAVLAALLLVLAGCGASGAGAAGQNPPPAETVPPADGEAASAGGALPDGAADAGTALELYCFSAGKADAFLLTTQESAVLIDTGEKGFGKEILAYLEALGRDRLDYLILSHFDQDHVGGAAKVLNSIPVGTVLQSNHPKDSEEVEKYLKALDKAGVEPVTVRETYRFTLDGVQYEVDPPRRSDYDKDASNNSSLIVSVINGEDQLLFAGDAEELRMEEFVSFNAVDYDFLKLPHHGNWHGTLPELLESTTPEYVLITSSDAQPEDSRTLALLAGRGIEVYLTREAPVLLESGGDGVSLRYAA